MTSASNLGASVLEVVKGVLIHQQPRWGVLVGQQRQLEAWWKHEIVSALQAWTWAWERDRAYWVASEIKPREWSVGVDSGEAVDVLIAPWREDETSPGWDQEEGNRVWLELKERGTWWGNPGKALGTSNGGLYKDLEKWRRAQWTSRDAVYACHLLTHECDRASDGANPIPSEWDAALRDVRDEHPSVGEPFIVGSPCESTTAGNRRARWVRLDIFALNPAAH